MNPEKSAAPGSRRRSRFSTMEILQAVVMAATLALLVFAWRLTFEVEALEELTASPAGAGS